MPRPPGRLVLRNGVALCGPELQAVPFASLLVEEGCVRTISGEWLDAGEESDSLDVDGAFVIPGLIDAHVHLDMAAQPMAYRRWQDSRMTLLRSLTCLHNGLVALRRGITSVRDLGSVDATVIDYANCVNGGRLVGPRVVAAGRPITITGGHCAQYGRTACGATDMRQAVREQVAAGAHVIKVMASGGISTPGDPSASQFTMEEMVAGVEEAHRLGRQVAAHAHAAAAIAVAVEAGVDSIEHAGFADAETLELLRSRDVTLVPTVMALNRIAEGAGIPSDTVAKSLAARETYRASTQAAIGAGVRIAAGTDAGTALNPLGDLVDELDMYCERGMQPDAALRAATVNAGRLIAPDVGMIEVGLQADLVVVRDDPRRDLSTLRDPVAVVSRGRRISLGWLDETIAELADVVTE